MRGKKTILPSILGKDGNTAQSSGYTQWLWEGVNIPLIFNIEVWALERPNRVGGLTGIWGATTTWFVALRHREERFFTQEPDIFGSMIQYIKEKWTGPGGCGIGLFRPKRPKRTANIFLYLRKER